MKKTSYSFQSECNSFLFVSVFRTVLDNPILDQLNGKWPIIHLSKPCSPYGIGGTPNSCNGI